MSDTPPRSGSRWEPAAPSDRLRGRAAIAAAGGGESTGTAPST